MLLLSRNCFPGHLGDVLAGEAVGLHEFRGRTGSAETVAAVDEFHGGGAGCGEHA